MPSAVGRGEVDWELLADVTAAVVRAVARADQARLGELVDRLTPAAAALGRRLAREAVPAWVLRASRVMALAASARAGLHELEQTRPGVLLSGIPHGEALLRALAKPFGAGAGQGRGAPASPAEPARTARGAYVPVRLDELGERLGASDGGLPGGAPVPSRFGISRSLAALERAGFIHVIGATRSRRYTLLPLAWRWLDEEAEATPSIHLSLPEAPAVAAGPALADGSGRARGQSELKRVESTERGAFKEAILAAAWKKTA